MGDLHHWVVSAESSGNQMPPYAISFESSRRPFYDVAARVANRSLVLRISNLTKKVYVYQVLLFYNKKSFFK